MSIFANRGEFESAYRSAIARAVAGGTFGHDLIEADRGANVHQHREAATEAVRPSAPTSAADTSRSRLSLAVDRHIAGNRAAMVDDPSRAKTGLSAAVDRETAALRNANASRTEPTAETGQDARSGLSRAVDRHIASLRQV